MNTLRATVIERGRSMGNREVVRDFHLHTYYSDGLYSPRVLLGEASKQGVAELAITDHDSIGGLTEAGEAATNLGITLIPGVEMSTEYLGVETHILGYGFNPTNVLTSPLHEYMMRIRNVDYSWARRVVRLSQREPIIVSLGGGGRREISVHESELERFSQSTIPSYFHFGLLVKDKLESIAPEFKDVPARHIFYFLFRRKEQEYIDRYKDLFEKYGIENKEYWHVPREDLYLLAAPKVVEMLLRVGAIPVIAHPGETGLMEEQIRDMKKMGVKGVEVYTPKHDETQTTYYEGAADSYGLFRISGTDFHDPFHRNKVEIGRDKYGRRLTRGVSAEDLVRVGG